MIERPCKGALFGEGEVGDRREQTAVERGERSDGDQGESYRIKRLRCPRGEAMVKDIGGETTVSWCGQCVCLWPR